MSLGHEARLAALEAAAPQLGAAFGLRAETVRRLPSLGRAIFALATPTGRYILRVHHERESCAELESLLRWLQALALEGGLRVPRPLPTTQGEWLAAHRVDGLPGAQRCSLLTWLARLHSFAERWRPPPGFTRPRLDAAGLFAERSPYASATGDSLFSAELVALMAAVAQRTRALLQRLDPEPGACGLIHGDFIVKNCLFMKDGVGALDFDNCARGYFLYDLAPARLQFSALPRRVALTEALWAGYTARRPVSLSQREDLETLAAARLVASCRWLVANQHAAQVRARTAELLAQRAETLRDFLATGRIRRRSAML